MTDDSMIPLPGNVQSFPDDAEIARKTALWNAQRSELAEAISPSMDYTRLVWNAMGGIGDPDTLRRYMLDKECAVADVILSWINDRPIRDRYRKAIQSLPFQSLPDPDTTYALRVHLWNEMNASRLISSYDAPSVNALLWQFALLRLSGFLNTGNWLTAARSLNTPARA